MIFLTTLVNKKWPPWLTNTINRGGRSSYPSRMCLKKVAVNHFYSVFYVLLLIFQAAGPSIFLFLLSLWCLHFSREFYDPSACSFPVFFFSYRPDHLPLLAQVGLPGAPFSFPLAITNRRPPPVSTSFLVPALGVGGHIVVVARRSANELGSCTPLVLRSHTSPRRWHGHLSKVRYLGNTILLFEVQKRSVKAFKLEVWKMKIPLWNSEIFI